MQTFTDFLRRHSLVAGLVLIYLLSWPFMLANSGVIPIQLPFAVGVTVGWWASIAALIMTGLTLGRAAVVALLKRFLIWRVGFRWYLVALLTIPAIFTCAVLLYSAFTHTPLDFSNVYAHRIFGASASLPAFILPFLVFDMLTNGEELAWRAYVLPRLQPRMGALAASLVVGLVWGLWHLPKYLGPNDSSLFPWMMLKTLADAVIYTWAYNSTRGSLLLTTLLHAAGNTAGVFLPIANTQSSAAAGAYITAIALEILVAVAITFVAGPARLGQAKPIAEPGQAL